MILCTSKMNANTKPHVLGELQGQSELSLNEHCQLWTGMTKTNKNAKYGVLNLKVDHIRWRVFHVHRLAYMAEHNDSNLDAVSDCSHMCHNSLCINPAHISLENHSVNNNRQACKGTGVCSGHGECMDCRLNLIVT